MAPESLNITESDEELLASIEKELEQTRRKLEWLEWLKQEVENRANQLPGQ